MGLGKSLRIRSSGAPTAWHQARAAVRLIICRMGLAPRCRGPLNSHVRRCPMQTAKPKNIASSCCGQPLQGWARSAPNPSVPRSGSGDREAPVVRLAELRVRQCGSAQSRPRSTSGHRPSCCAGRLSFGSGVHHRQCSFVVGAAPNSAFKRTANSVAPWPRGRAVCHRPRGQGATLSSAA